MGRESKGAATDETLPASAAASALEALVRPGALLLDRYRVERVLGEGGMGTVIAARHIELDELFAFKFMHAEAARRSETVDRFLREARAAAKLRSEHVARVLDVARLPSGEPYILMEHLMGTDLDAWLVANGRASVEDAARWVLQACEAVAEAHARGIVHRDLKPSNLFLHETGTGKTIVKVLDFGISKKMDAALLSVTSTRSLLGSPLYMSPEQALQPRAVDARSDIWSIGVVLYELATGLPPFLGETVPEVVASVLQTDPAPPSEHLASLPAWFDEIVLTCLRKSPERRFQSVAELTAALRAGLDLPLSAPDPPSPREPPESPRVTPRSRTSPAARSIAMTPDAALTVTSASSALPMRKWPLVVAGGALISLVAGVAILAMRDAPPPLQRTASVAPDTPSARDIGEAVVTAEPTLAPEPPPHPPAEAVTSSATPASARSVTRTPRAPPSANTSVPKASAKPAPTSSKSRP